jgi:hypothetical protein
LKYQGPFLFSDHCREGSKVHKSLRKNSEPRSGLFFHGTQFDPRRA